MNFWKLYVSGGWVMIPITICSFFSLAIILERFIFWFSLNKKKKKVIPLIFQYLREGQIVQAQTLSSSQPYYLTNIIKAGLNNSLQSPEIIKESLEAQYLNEVPKLEKNLHFLSVIAYISPLMGLLGTVLGLVKCFYLIEQKTVSIGGMVNPSDLAGGIWEALITTVGGLIVAIPAYIAYSYFAHRVHLATLESENISTRLLVTLGERREQVEIF